jgi:DNA transformation protein
MGEKGARQSAAGAEAAEALVDDLQPLGAVVTKRMFGGFGVFLDGTMFALVDPSGGVFLRGDDTTAGEFASAGSAKHGRMPYWEMPDTVRSNADQLEVWAQRALTIAEGAKRG